MSLILKRPVIVKHVVTESFKDQVLDEIQRALEQVDGNLTQLDFQARRMIAELERQDPQRASQAREELRRERQRQETIREELQLKRRQIETLEDGSIFVAGSYDAPVVLEVGQHFGRRMSQAEIIVKDGIIIEIRE